MIGSRCCWKDEVVGEKVEGVRVVNKGWGFQDFPIFHFTRFPFIIDCDIPCHRVSPSSASSATCTCSSQQCSSTVPPSPARCSTVSSSPTSSSTP